jgi:rhomboid protease GluP
MAPPWARGSTTTLGLTQVLVGINAVVFAAMVMAGVSLTSPTSPQLLHWGANFGPLTLGGQWWRLLTSMFLHIGIIHIAFNMWCLWDLGALCESLYGRWTFGAVYVISGVAASLTSVAWHPHGISAGASGAIFGVAGALIASLKLGEFSVPQAAVRGTLRSVIMFAGYNLVFGAMSRRTDNSAHLGGFVCGLILGALIARVAPDRDDQVRRFSVLVVVLLAVVGGGAWLQHARSYLVHLQRGSALLEQNKPDQAIAELQTAVQQRLGYAPGHQELAHAYYNAGQFDKAEAELRRVIELQPRDQSAYYALGSVYLEQQRPHDARETFTHLLALNPNSADAHFGLGRTSAAEDDPLGAIREFQAAARLDAEMESVYYYLGLSYARLKQYDEAIAAYQKEQEKNGDDYDTQIALAHAYQAKGMQAQAEAALQKAAQLKSTR